MTMIGVLSFTLTLVLCVTISQSLAHLKLKIFVKRIERLEAALATVISGGEGLIGSEAQNAFATPAAAAASMGIATSPATRSDRVIRLVKELVAAGSGSAIATFKASRIVDQEMQDEAKRK